MDKLSEYIPLLIILVYVLFTALGKKKKPGKITQKTTLPGKTIEDFFDFEEEEEPQSYRAPYQTFTKEEPIKQTVRNVEITPENKISSLASTHVMLESEDEEHSHFSFEDEEEVKRAIIYAEIINRKEY